MPEQKFTQEQLANEEWLALSNWENAYSISTLGRVRSERGRNKGHVLHGYCDPQGYRIVKLCRDGRKTGYAVHRLVMQTFEGPCPEGHQVNHINGIKSDARLSNLEYVTSAQDKHHAQDVLGRNVSRVSEDTLASLFILRAAGWYQTQIGAYLGLSQSYVSLLLLTDYTALGRTTIGR